jgi:predicted ATPase/class 3 adenylate cyclase
MDIGGWLRSLGLERYEAAFRENEITDKVLPDLTVDDLKDLGVTIVGHRRTLLNAITALRSDKHVEAAPAPPAPETPAKDTAERRQVTVLFSDLVGSTALSARMDPEDLRDLIGAYQKSVAETVRQFDGFVAKYLGDGALVYFGYPQAHEDDAERAVRAGLELIAAVTALKSSVPLKTRIGIATGLVVVGDLVGSGEAQERGIVGETPNLAARLQGIAEPNTVVIAENTRRLLGNLFELEDLGARDLKGIADPARAWAALRPRSVESRFEALHGAGLTELVGREEEIELLLRRWSRAKSGEGQVVLISGEPGIGKSRLTAAVMERLVSEPHTRLRYFCSPQHTDSALYPIIGQMERAAGMALDDTPHAKLDKLDAVLSHTSTTIDNAGLLAEMLSLPNDGRYPTIELTPQQRRERTLQALVLQLEALSRQAPVLMIFEDAHWADPTSVEVLGLLVARITKLSVLLIATFRPEFEPPWIGQPHVSALTVSRLPERHVGFMIDRVVGNKKLSASLRQDIVDRTDGIPLFVEEMTKAVLEAGSEDNAYRSAAAVPLSVSSVPASLHASLMARLDRLGPAKEIAQIGAAIGREFSHRLLEAVAGKPEAQLRSGLDRLVDSGLLFRQGTPPHATYLFKHALLQDAAYGTLLREPRRALHARIADSLEAQFPEIVENQPELLARHCTDAGLMEKAAVLWGKAGQRSLARSASVEASQQLNRAISQIVTLPATLATRREEIKLQVALINAFYQVKGGAAPETKAATERARLLIERAEALGEPLEDPLLLFGVLYSFATASYFAFNGDLMRDIVAQFLTLAQKQSATFPLVMAYRMMGIALLCTGEMMQGRAYSDRALELFDIAEHRPMAARFGQDARVAALSYRSLALWMLGHPNAALADTEQALKDAREIGHTPTLMYALVHASFTQIYCGNYTAASTQADEVRALADKVGASFWKAVGMMLQGWVMVPAGQAARAVASISSAISALELLEARLWAPSSLSYLAFAYAEVRQFDDARRCIREALEAVEKSKETWCEAEVYRRAGEIEVMLQVPDVQRAEDNFARALSVARAQHAKSWELRAAMSMARLWRDEGKRQQAYNLLAPIYGWFTEGFDTLDLREARALLGELAQ